MSYNGIVLLNKPQGPTSHDMVNEMRRLFGTKKVGHTGTLDPMATGVLPICVGNATKAADMLVCETKEYIAQIKFGMSTDTGDITGSVIDTSHIIPTQAEITHILTEFEGELMQTPPMYSAKKIDGKKLYELARLGESVQRKAVPITVYRAEYLRQGEIADTHYIRVACSKGTYIRVLCEDIGKKLGTCACMSELTRTASGDFRIENAYTLQELKEAAEKGELLKAVIPTQSLFDYEKIVLSEKQSERMKNGVFVSHTGIVDGKLYRVFDSNNEFFAVSQCVDGRLRIKKSFRV